MLVHYNCLSAGFMREVEQLQIRCCYDMYLSSLLHFVHKQCAFRVRDCKH